MLHHLHNNELSHKIETNKPSEKCVETLKCFSQNFTSSIEIDFQKKSKKRQNKNTVNDLCPKVFTNM